jgi:hemolysin D
MPDPMLGFMKSGNQLAKVIPLPRGSAAARRDRLEFLPAALEVMETPASPVGRTMAGVIVLFFTLAIVWATFGRVDIVATATGKIVDAGRSKTVQPFETGVVRRILVQDGQAVKSGDVLIELDPTINTAERDRAAADLIAEQLDVARLKAALAGADDPDVEMTVPPGASAAQAQMHQTLLRNQIAEFDAKLAGVDRQIAEHEANLAAVGATVEKLKLTLPLLQQKADARQYLAEKGLGSKITYWENEQDLLEHQQELVVQTARLDEAAAQIAALKQQRLQTTAEYRRTNFSDLAQAAQKAATAQATLVAAEEKRQLQTLTAPVDGTVQQLAVHTVGGVVTPAQQLMVIVPTGDRLEAEVMVSNRDIGFIDAGEHVEIKVDTFNFTRYGLLHGTVLSVSHDSMVRDKPASDRSDQSAQTTGALSDTSEPKGQELVYAARVALDRTEMEIEGKLVSLTPGMAVTAEVKTGSRRVIQYLLSPLLRYKQESLRER